MRLGAVFLTCVAVGSLSTDRAFGASPYDILLSVDGTFLSGARLQDRSSTFQALTQSLIVELGFEDFGFGVEVRNTVPLESRLPAEGETGVMLRGRYSPVLNGWLRLDVLARAGLTHGVSDARQPLYGTESDIRATFVVFDANGLGSGSDRVFFSGHLGGSLNWVGRPQVIGGLGGWWRQLGFFTTVFYSLMGEEQPIERLGQFDIAQLKDAGIALSLSWDIDLGNEKVFQVRVTENIPIQNGATSTTLTLSWSLPSLDPEEASEELAW